MRLDALVTHRQDGFRSGVARFNELLSSLLGVSLLGLHDSGVEQTHSPLLSFKVSEFGEADRARVDSLLDVPGWEPELFLHEHSDNDLERRLVAAASRVYCGNSQILVQVGQQAREARLLWSPGLILDHRVFQPAEISVFSFGMAHKVRTDMFRRLRRLLDNSGASYGVYISAANHETASLRDAAVIFDEMHDLFDPKSLYFLGNLSDVAVFNQLRSSTFFAAFFDEGVRANNGSVGAAMELGAVVITNLDEYSPAEFVHMDNVIDIERCDSLPHDPMELHRISVRAMETGRARGWDSLVAELTKR